MTEPRIPWTHKPTGRVGGHDRRARSAGRLALLAEAPLFEGLAKTELRRIAKVSGARTFDPGDELVKEGVPGRIFYIVVEGRARNVRRGRTIGLAGPGDSFGEMAILTTAPRSASVVAETPMEVLTLSGADLRTILLDEPRIAVRLLDTLAQRLADLDRRFIA
ncbi:MAG: cyclic nucleotide-binding domain-containing protein [Actinobacteria bacterium]|nr:MAG: cyclic nucleotide-binding domain-containing protein [Actinomycetota bacterium]